VKAEPDLPEDERALAYAEKLYSTFLKATCPGTTGHEGASPGSVTAIYCDRCIMLALAVAWKAGRNTW
jgi:hypothetical protein